MTGAASVEPSTMTLGCSGKWSAGRFSAIAGAAVIAFTKNPCTEIQRNCSKCEKKLGEVDDLVNETLASTPSGLLRNRRSKTTYNDEQHPSASLPREVCYAALLAPTKLASWRRSWWCRPGKRSQLQRRDRGHHASRSAPQVSQHQVQAQPTNR